MISNLFFRMISTKNISEEIVDIFPYFVSLTVVVTAVWPGVTRLRPEQETAGII